MSSEQQQQQHHQQQQQGSSPQRSPLMDAAVVGDSSLPQVSNFLRKLAQQQAGSQQQQQPSSGPSKLGLSPFSLRERLLSGEVGASSLTAAESRSSSDMSVPFESDLQSLWDLAGGQQQQQTPQYEGSPLNPNADLRQQIHLRQQLGLLSAALMPRGSNLGPSQPTDSAGSGENRPKRRWADALGETNSLPSSAPGSPHRSAPAGDNLAQLLLEGPTGSGGADGGTHGEKTGSEPPEGKKDDLSEWEPRVRRKKGKGAGSDDEGAASDGGGQRIKAKSMTERQRRDRISDALRRLRGAVNSHGDMATMLNEAVDLIQQQKRRIEELEMQILQQRLRQQLAGGCRTLF